MSNPRANEALARPELGPVLAEAIAPPPPITASQWAERHRVVSGKAAAEPGPWRNARTPFAVAMMDAFSDPGVEEVVVMAASQIVKTEVILNVTGYFIDADPCPLLIVQPTLEDRGYFSKERLAPMLEDCAPLKAKVAEAKSRDSDSTIAHKTFPGGFAAIVTAQSPSGLRGRPVRVVLMDEIDAYKETAEGDPCDLARKRTARFWNRKIGYFSSPGEKGQSRVEALYQESDRRKWWVPCPECGRHQVLRPGGVHWEKELDEAGEVRRGPDGRALHHPETAVYVCEHCGACWNDAARFQAIARGEWRAEAPGSRRAGFWLNGLYRPNWRLADYVREFLEARKLPGTLRVFVNTEWAETWEEQGASLDGQDLLRRVEDYQGVPAAVALLTATVDVQDDRLEVEVVGWGRDEESWQVEYAVIPGNPGLPAIWDQELYGLLSRTWDTRDGRTLPLRAVGVDSGGHHTTLAYRFCQRHWHRRWWALKGDSRGLGKPIWPPALTRSQKHRGARLWLVNVDEAKKVVSDYLKLDAPGPGYCHFPNGRDRSYFEQFAAEKLVTRYVRGFPRKVWEKRAGKRNEALDLRAYNVAVLCGLRAMGVDLNRECDRIGPKPERPPLPPPDAGRPRPLTPPPGGGVFLGAALPSGAAPLIADPYL